MTKPPPIIHTCKPEQLVPAHLRRWLCWDERHDAAAQQVMAEYNLVLPRDRELIRQLAFVRVEQHEREVIRNDDIQSAKRRSSDG